MEPKKGPFGNLVLIFCLGLAIFLVVLLVLAIVNGFFPGRL